MHKSAQALAVDREVNRSKESALWNWPRLTDPERELSGYCHGRPDSRPTGKLSWGGRPTTPTVRNRTVGRSTGRSTDRPFWAWSGPQQLYFENPINMGSLGLFLLRFWRKFFPIFLSVFSKFSKQVLVLKSLSLFVFKVLKYQRKSSLWEFYYVLHFIYLSRSFSQVFSLLFYFQTFWLLTYLSQSILILSLGSCYCEKIVCDPLRSPRESLWSLHH